jgi:sugar phosphate isomerase/epimerase
MTRRQTLGAPLAAAALATSPLASTPLPAAPSRVLKNLGTASPGLGARIRHEGDKWDIVEYCREKGLGAPHIYFPLDQDAAKTAKIRKQLNDYDMRAVFLVRTPRTKEDLPKYEAALKAIASMDGRAACVHDPFSGRRYEQFKTAAEFHQFFAQCKAGVQLAEPLLRKYKLPLAIENHKGWRSAELVDWVKATGSEYVGVCLDLVNNVSMIETPEQTIDALMPYTIYVSFKDIGVDFYDQGILLSEVPFGDGHLDLKAIVARGQKKDPNMIFQIEMLTRDPLEVPVFTEQYWKVWDDKSPVPAQDLAMLVHYIRTHPPKKPLPRISGLTPAQRLALEDQFNQQCIDYARAHLPF